MEVGIPGRCRHIDAALVSLTLRPRSGSGHNTVRQHDHDLKYEQMLFPRDQSSRPGTSIRQAALILAQQMSGMPSCPGLAGDTQMPSLPPTGTFLSPQLAARMLHLFSHPAATRTLQMYPITNGSGYLRFWQRVDAYPMAQGRLLGRGPPRRTSDGVMACMSS